MVPPKLVRTSSLHPKYIEENFDAVSTPVNIEVDKNIMSMTENWNKEEIENQRRLVKFSFKLMPPATYKVDFNQIDSKDFTNEVPIISCIYWKEKNIHIVTSVDIILILEYLVQESFNIEEKNRIRRNLQFLKPFTISRSNKSNQRFFNLLMGMEDPRPRNIEKDLKVFKWSDFFNAISKVISKYSTNTTLGVSNNATPNLQQYSLATSRGRKDEYETSKKESSQQNNLPTVSEITRDYSSQQPTDESFMPFERLKVMKKKNSQLSHLNVVGEDNTSKSYSHALKPSLPIPLGYGNDVQKTDESYSKDDMEVDEGSVSDSHSSHSNLEKDPNKDSKESLAKSDESTISMDRSASNSDSSESGGVSSSDYNTNGSSSANAFSNGISSVQTTDTSGTTSVGTFKNARTEFSPGYNLFEKVENVSDLHHPQYYQYPSHSQLYHKDVAPVSNLDYIDSDRRKDLKQTVQSLPSLKANINRQISSDVNNTKTQLPPILQQIQKNFSKKSGINTTKYSGQAPSSALYHDSSYDESTSQDPKTRETNY